MNIRKHVQTRSKQKIRNGSYRKLEANTANTYKHGALLAFRVWAETARTVLQRIALLSLASMMRNDPLKDRPISRRVPHPSPAKGKAPAEELPPEKATTAPSTVAAMIHALLNSRIEQPAENQRPDAPHERRDEPDATPLGKPSPADVSRRQRRATELWRELAQGVNATQQGKYSRTSSAKRRTFARQAWDHNEEVRTSRFADTCSPDCPFKRECDLKFTGYDLQRVHEEHYGKTTAEQQPDGSIKYETGVSAVRAVSAVSAVSAASEVSAVSEVRAVSAGAADGKAADASS